MIDWDKVIDVIWRLIEYICTFIEELYHFVDRNVAKVVTALVILAFFQLLSRRRRK